VVGRASSPFIYLIIVGRVESDNQWKDEALYIYRNG